MAMAYIGEHETSKLLTVRLDDELHKAFKVKCVLDGVDMNAVVTKLIEDYVNEAKLKLPSRPKK